MGQLIVVLLEIGKVKHPGVAVTESVAKQLAAADALMKTEYSFKNVPPQLKGELHLQYSFLFEVVHNVHCLEL